MILLVHFCLNLLTLAYIAGHLGHFVDLQLHFLPIILLYEIVFVFNAQHLASNGLNSLLLAFLAYYSIHREFSVFRHRLASHHSICCQSHIINAKQESTKHDSYGKMYHGASLGLTLLSVVSPIAATMVTSLRAFATTSPSFFLGGNWSLEIITFFHSGSKISSAIPTSAQAPHPIEGSKGDTVCKTFRSGLFFN